MKTTMATNEDGMYSLNPGTTVLGLLDTRIATFKAITTNPCDSLDCMGS